MSCSCKTQKEEGVGLFGSQHTVKHFDIDMECLECGYQWPHISIDEAAYYVRTVLLKMRCPICDAHYREISAVIRVSPDRFSNWDGQVNAEVDDIVDIYRMAREVRQSQGGVQ